MDEGSKVIVWTSFVGAADWISREMAEFGTATVHGKMNIDDRNRALDRFREQDSCRVLVATPGAAKEGLTLTAANRAVFYDRTFSLDDYLQAQDRIHRISQVRTCYVYNIILRDSVDEWVEVLLAAKQLAAQLGQGDISKAVYDKAASYEFGEMLKDVLNIDDSRARGNQTDTTRRSDG